jgi:uncharacterized phage protein (TIGR01671 family)
MSRKIKFRGKVTKGYQESFFKQKFVYGNVIYCEDDIESTIINEEFEATVDTDSIGQFTGFFDKNGKEIYEGDFVKDGSTTGYNYLMEVYWDDKFQWSLRLPKINNNFSGSLSNDKYIVPQEMRIEIIGNIHENPELLNS